MSPIGEHLGMSGDREIVGARRCARPGRAWRRWLRRAGGQRRRLHAGRPHRGVGVDAGAVAVRAERRRRRWRRRRRPGRPCAARRRGARAPWSPCRRADRRRSPAARLPPSSSSTRTTVGSNVRNSPRRQRSASSRTWPASSHARRAGADDDDREPPVALDRVGRRLGHLEGAEEATAELQGVVDRLHARRMEGELVVAEVRLAGAGGDDQAVVGHLDRAQVRRAPGVDHAGVEIEAGHLGELHADVVGPAHDVAYRRCDLARREHARRHLVQQRLEEVVVAAVDQRDVDGLAGRGAGRPSSPPKPPPTTTTRWRGVAVSRGDPAAPAQRPRDRLTARGWSA